MPLAAWDGGESTSKEGRVGAAAKVTGMERKPPNQVAENPEQHPQQYGVEFEARGKNDYE
jgi:hypothetical protein